MVANALRVDAMSLRTLILTKIIDNFIFSFRFDSPKND